jgi:hypothetical protein
MILVATAGQVGRPARTFARFATDHAQAFS